MIQVRNSVSCTKAEGAETTVGGLEDILEANLSGTCNKLAVVTDRGRSDGGAFGLSGSGSRRDGRQTPGFTEVEIHKEDKDRGAAGCKYPALLRFRRFLGLLSFLESNYSTPNQLFIASSHRVISFKLEGISKIS